MQTVWTQSGLTKCWTRTEFKLFDTDAIPERICIKRMVILKNMNRWQKHAKLPSKISLAKIYNRQEKVPCVLNTVLSQTQI